MHFLIRKDEKVFLQTTKILIRLDVEANLSLCWLYMLDGTFSYVEAHIIACLTDIHYENTPIQI